MASVRDIAQATGVSITTVSRVLNSQEGVSKATRDRVLEAANRAGYVQSVGRRDTSNIGLVYTGRLEWDIGSPFDTALMRGMTSAMHELGFDLVLMDAERSREPGERFTQLFLRKGIRGVLIRTGDGTRHLASEIVAEGFPAVVVADRFEGSETVSYVDADSRTGSREATEYLIGLGHRRIAICLYSEEVADMRDRLAGYREAHAIAGLEPDPSLVLRVPTPWRRDGGGTLLRWMLGMPEPPTAVYAADPFTTAGIVAEAHRIGLRIPLDLSLVGFDDSDQRLWATPQISAVCQDASSLGRQAFFALRRVLDGAGPVQEVLKTWFEPRGSTGPAPGSRMPGERSVVAGAEASASRTPGAAGAAPGARRREVIP